MSAITWFASPDLIRCKSRTVCCIHSKKQGFWSMKTVDIYWPFFVTDYVPRNQALRTWKQLGRFNKFTKVSNSTSQIDELKMACMQVGTLCMDSHTYFGIRQGRFGHQSTLTRTPASKTWLLATPTQPNGCWWSDVTTSWTSLLQHASWNGSSKWQACFV